MSTGKEPNKRGIISRWVFSYLAVFVIPLVVFIIVSMQFVRILDREVRYYNTLSVDMIRVRMDYILNEVNTVAAEVVILPSLGQILSASNRDELPPLMLNEAIKELNRMQIRKDQIENFFIYFPSIDLTINSSTYNTGMDFHQAYMANSSLSYTQWTELMGSSHQSTKIMDFYYDSPAGKSDYILIIRPVSFIQRGQMYANIAFIMGRDAFISAENGIEPHSIFIEDRINGNIVYSSLNPDVPERIAGNIPGDIASIISDTRNFLVVSVDSRTVNWRYIIAEYKTTYLKQVNLLRQIFIVCLCVCFVLGFFFVLMIVKYNWKRLIKAWSAIDEINPSPSGQVPKAKNEYQYFSNAISSLQQEKSVISGRLQQQQSLLRSQVILSMIENTTDAKNVSPQDLEFYGITFQSDIFVVMLMQLRFDRPVSEEKKYWPIVEELVLKIFPEKNISAFPFHTEKYTGFVMNPGEPDDEKLYSALVDGCNSITTAAAESLHFWISFSCSVVQHSYSSLNRAYMEALDAMEYKSRAGGEEILFYRDIVEVTKRKNFTYTGEQELLISSELEKGNAEKVLRTMKETIDSNFAAGVSPKMMRYLLFNIAGTIIRVYNHFDERILEFLPEISMPAVLRTEDFDATYREVEQVVRNICAAIEQINRVQGPGSQEDYALSKYAVLFVNDFFADKTLNVSSIADELNVSVVHLSRAFKKTEGIFLSDHINLVRIANAKKLILANETLSATADLSGFGSFRTFMRVFKKYEGVTPGQYKSMKGKGKDLPEDG